MEGKTKENEMENFKEDLKNVLAGVLPTVVGFILFNIPAQAAMWHGMIIFMVATMLIATHIGCAISWGDNILGDEQ